MSERSPERASAASADEIEAELRRENPKGHLWERCAQLHPAAPAMRYRVIDGTHQAEMTLEVGDWELASGVQSGWSRKMVEQLAARELLAELESVLAEERAAAPPPAPRAGGEDEEDVWEVAAQDAERVHRTNPKGQLFEWCQKHKIARPRFEARKAKGGGAHVRASLVTLHLSSPWFRASQAKIAEQAAAEALLPLLPEEVSPSGPAQLDPRAALHELWQRGLIAEYAFETTTHDDAPPHARRFTAIGRATRADGAIVKGEPIEASSKKEARLLAARALLDRLGDLAAGA